jgi:hypothetical protein
MASLADRELIEMAPDPEFSPSAGPPGDIRTQHHQTARSITILLARNPDEMPGLRAAGEPRLDVNERAHLAPSAAIHEHTEARDPRGRIVLIPER